MLLKYSASMAIKSCGITGLGSGLRVDGFGNGGSLVLVVFVDVVFAVGFALAVVFGFAFACAIGFALCAVAFFAVAGFTLVVGFFGVAFFATGFFVVGFFFATVFVFAMILLLSIDVLGYTHTVIVAFFREIEKAARCLIENVTEKGRCLK